MYTNSEENSKLKEYVLISVPLPRIAVPSNPTRLNCNDLQTNQIIISKEFNDRGKRSLLFCIIVLQTREALELCLDNCMRLQAGNWVSAENINFYNVRPPLDPTPFPNSFKCFTCDNAVDNYNCNRWAEDRWCPESTQYCLTVHLFTDHGKSASVTKKCATGEECHFVGCHHHRESGHTECVSCCEGMICNVEIPTNHTNAVFAVLHARRTSDGNRRTVNIALLVSAVMIALKDGSLKLTLKKRFKTVLRKIQQRLQESLPMPILPSWRAICPDGDTLCPEAFKRCFKVRKQGQQPGLRISSVFS
ncbi:ly6/PLAUR domain-containing protein 6B [Grus japonensis]|uniref:Ly6/PLAUR domain-containing protein 6B n=1 Tax=Grus japonensis TaxID=30415 RepID=A0ABC9X1M2_GRUJA